MVAGNGSLSLSDQVDENDLLPQGGVSFTPDGSGKFVWDFGMICGQVKFDFSSAKFDDGTTVVGMTDQNGAFSPTLHLSAISQYFTSGGRADTINTTRKTSGTAVATAIEGFRQNSLVPVANQIVDALIR